MFIYRGKLDWYDYAKDEGVTVVFPLELRIGDPVYTIFQWTQDASDGKKTNVFLSGTVDSLTILEVTSKSIGWCHDDYYSFTGVFSDSEGYKKLSVTMHNKAGDKGDANTLDLVFDSTQDRYQKLEDPSITPRIYMGKLTNWGTYADNELLVIVAPMSMCRGDPICAFWQWTKVDKGDTKVNVDAVKGCYISNQENIDEVGESFTFTHGNYYTFSCKLKEASSQLEYEMKNPQGESTGKLTLDLQELETASTRKRRAVFNHKTVVLNNTSEIVVCSLKASGTGLADRLLATASLMLGGAGLVAALVGSPTTLAAAVGVFLASAGWHVAVGGMVQVFNSSGEETSAVMFPGDTMSRHSSGSFFSSDNDLDIMTVRVEGKRRLVISTAYLEKAGDSTKELSDLMPDSTSQSRPHYTELLSLSLPSDMKVLPYRNIVIAGLKMSHDSAKDYNGMKEGDIPNALTSYDKGYHQLRWYGTLDNYYDAVVAAKESNLWVYDYDYGMTFSQGVTTTGSSHAKVIAVPLSNGQELIILKLSNCIVEGKWVESRSLKGCKSENDVKAQIKDNGNYFAYAWPSASKWLTAYLPSYETRFTYSENANNCVFFVASSCSPIMSLVAA